MTDLENEKEWRRFAMSKLEIISNKIDEIKKEQTERDLRLENRMTKSETKLMGWATFITIAGTTIINVIIKKL